MGGGEVVGHCSKRPLHRQPQSNYDAIDTGQVILTSLGAPDRQDRTVMGMPVNLAERLQAQATPGRVWLSQATFERLSDPSGCYCLGPIEVKGRQEPLVVYEKL